MKKDRFYYSANLAGLTVLLYLALGLLLRTLLSALLGVHLSGANLTNPVGIPEAAIQLLNCLCTILNIGLPMLFLLQAERPLGIKLPGKRVSSQILCTLLPIFLLFTTVCTALATGLRSLLSRGGYSVPAATLPESSAALFLCLISTCVLPAVGEELLFRGALQNLLRPWGDRFAIVVVSIFFSLLHRDLSQLPSIFAMSLFLGAVAVRYDSMMPSILLHLANNLSSFLLLWARSRMDATSLLGLSTTLFMIYVACGIFATVYAVRNRMFAPLPRHPKAKNQMSLAERLLYAPVYSMALLLLILTAVMEYVNR